MNAPEFLTLDDVLQLHADSIEAFGGLDGVRNRGLLESALAAPRASFGGDYLATDLFEMAAAYLVSLGRNHAFIDGNKRTALMAALVFLDLNGIDLDREDERLYDLTIKAATGGLDRAGAASELRLIATATH